MSDIVFKTPDGEFVRVDAKNAAWAQKDAGYTPATVEDYEASKHPIRAGVESAASLGGFVEGPIRNAEAGYEHLTKAEESANMLRRQIQNPAAAFTGELVGGIPAALAAPEGVLGAAGVGTLMGLGTEVKESVLEDRPVQGEKLALGALVGGVTGGALGAVGEGIKAVMSPTLRNIGADGLAARAKQMADRIEQYALGHTGPLEELQPALAFGRKYGILGKMGSAIDREHLGRIDEILGPMARDVEAASAPAMTPAGLALELDAERSARQGAQTVVMRDPQELAAGQHLRELMANRIDSLESRRGGALNMGLIGLALDHHPVAAIAGAIAKNQVMRRGPLVGAAALRLLEDDPAMLQSIADKLISRVRRVGEVAPKLLAGVAPGLEQAAAGGAMSLLAEHTRLGSGADGGQYLATLGYTKETPEEMQATSQRLATFHAIKQSAAQVDEQLNMAADKFFGAGGGGRLPIADTKVGDFGAKLAEIKAITSHPQGLLTQIPPHLLNIAPETMVTAAKTTLNAAKYLDGAAPKNPYLGIPPALRPQWKPSRSELHTWFSKVEAVENPGKVLTNLAQGRVNPAQWEALKNVYPQTAAQLEQRLFQHIYQSAKPVPYAKRLALSAVFGSKAFGMTPGQMALIQGSQAHAAVAQKGASGGPRGGGPDGRQGVDAKKNQETQSQRLEGR